MADMTVYRGNAQASAAKAVDLDTRGCALYNRGAAARNLDEIEKGRGLVRDAKDAYTKALNDLMLLMKFDKSETFLASYDRDAKQYLARMEKLKSMLEAADAPVAEAGFAGGGGGGGSGGGGGAHGRGGGGGGGADDEKAKFKDALASTILTERPNVPWAEIAGLDEAVKTLKQIVTMPRKFPQLFQGENKPFTTALFYGPPGTGKTQLAKAVVSARALARGSGVPSNRGRFAVELGPEILLI
jgi:hypothetical protein